MGGGREKERERVWGRYPAVGIRCTFTADCRSKELRADWSSVVLGLALI